MGNQLKHYLDTTVRELVAPIDPVLTEAQAERHRIYADLLRAITVYYWNGNKYGTHHTYPLNPPFSDENVDRSPLLRESYRGHNIAAIAVDARGYIIDFAFNHNEIFNSSIEHAESRLLRRIFSLRQVLDAWDVHGEHEPDRNYGNLLGGVSIYTTLESCSQCSGMMTLAGVKEVIYLQPDPDMYAIGTILRRLSKNDDPAETYLQAPLPISGEAIGLRGYREMDEKFKKFEEAQKKEEKPAFRLHGTDGSAKFTSNITSYLCTQPAYRFFLMGWNDLKALAERYAADPDATSALYRPKVESGTALTNAEALERAMTFYRYVRTKGDRGTPHRV